ncbi:MAG: hypothetical protein C0169_06590, partial [Thermodesulfobacterium geofontis]
KNYRFFFQFLPLNRKFLALVLYPQLQYLENTLKVYLGTAKEGKKRPCIFWKVSEDSKEFFKLVFLTQSKKTSVFINLKMCYEKEKRCGRGFVFYPNAFVFETPDKGPLAIKIKDKELLGEFINCGACEDLEVLEELKAKEF